MAFLLLACLVACAPPPVTFTPTPSPSATAVPTLTPTPLIESNASVPTATPLLAAGELHLAIRENIKTLNPYLASNASELFIVSLLYDTLLDYDLHQNLAQRWELAPDGLGLTFWLDPQARWHDGQPVTAQDVAFSFHFVQQAQFPGLARLVALVDRVEAISAEEVKFTLLKKDAAAAQLLGTALYIIPAHMWERLADPCDANLERPIGSGPFLLVEHAQGKYFMLSNTRMHPHAKPKVDKLVLDIVRDEGKALQMLKDGKLDALGWDVTPAVVSEVQKQAKGFAGIQWMEAPGTQTYTLLLNLRKSPYDNRALREALAQTLDTKAILDAALLGFGDIATPALFPPASSWRNAKIAALPFAPQQAIQKLESAGFRDRNGDGVRENPDGSPLQISILCPNLPASVRVAELIVAHWKAIGIAAQVKPIAQDALLPTLMQAQFDVALYSIDLSKPEMAFFYFHTSRGAVRNGRVTGLNYGGYSNAEYDEVASASLEEQDTRQRRELLYRLQSILAADLPQIPLYVPRVLNLYREDRFTNWSAEPGVGLLSRATIARLQPR